MKFLEFLSRNKVLYSLGIMCILLIVAIGLVRGNIDILDQKFFYLKSEIQPFLAGLGEEGIAAYLKVNILDFLFITTYTLFFFGMYTAFFKELAKSLIIIPTLLSIADTAETSIIYFLLKSYPAVHDTAEYFLMFLTPLKWLLALSSLLVIVNGYFLNLYMKNNK